MHFRKPKEKPKTQKRVPITPTVLSILNKAKELSAPSPYVFPWGGNLMTRNVLHAHIQGLGEDVGVKLSPHMLRHSGITDALKWGALMASVQAVAGHRLITTTRKYFHSDLVSEKKAMDALDLTDLQEAIGKHATTVLPPPSK